MMTHLLLCVPVVLLAGIVQTTLSHQQTYSDAFSEKFDSQMTLWFHALISTLLVSIAPFFILFCIPLDNTDRHSNFLKVLLSFASGGLLGDAFLHLIPHAIIEEDGHSHHDKDGNGHSHDHTQDMMIGLWVLGGIFTFLVVEKFVRLVKGHSEAILEKESKTESDDNNHGKHNIPEGLKHRNVTKQKRNEMQGSSSASHDQLGEIKVSAYLNLAADFSHNFTDGLAIGASYLAGRAIGIVTTFTILMHEVPHEIGDFAILIQSGYSRRRAMMLQLTTAFGALAGTVCGLMAEGLSVSATSWILPFTAGGFIYIATVSVIPELLENSSFWQSVKELLGICVGILMMVLIGYFE